MSSMKAMMMQKRQSSTWMAVKLMAKKLVLPRWTCRKLEEALSLLLLHEEVELDLVVPHRHGVVTVHQCTGEGLFSAQFISLTAVSLNMLSDLPHVVHRRDVESADRREPEVALRFGIAAGVTLVQVHHHRANLNVTNQLQLVRYI